MLLRFSVENYRSYHKRQVLDLTATRSCHERENDNTFVRCGERLLKNAVIYGANASGKSNLFLALHVMREIIKGSSKNYSSMDKLPIYPFLYVLSDDESKVSPSVFEIEFIIEETIFRYGFATTLEEVESEWLFKRELNQDEEPLFLRNNEEKDLIEICDGMKDAKDKGLEGLTRENALFLSVCDQFNIDIAKRILKWCVTELQVINGLSDKGYMGFTLHSFVDKDLKNDIMNFIKHADLNISDLKVESTNEEDMESGDVLKKFDIKSVHNIYDQNFNVISHMDVPFNVFESEGTKKALALSGPLIQTLKDGGILFIDEFEARLHPNFTSNLIKMFNSNTHNPNNAQFVVATHDTNLLKDKRVDEDTKEKVYTLRRDQVFFTEKNNGEATELYSLIDFIDESGRKVRKDASHEKDYLNGRYGAIPCIQDLVGGA